MKTRKIATYVFVVVSVILAWFVTRSINPGLITLIGIAIIVGSTAWFLVTLFVEPKNLSKRLGQWLKLLWDGFWGLG